VRDKLGLCNWVPGKEFRVFLDLSPLGKPVCPLFGFPPGRHLLDSSGHNFLVVSHVCLEGMSLFPFTYSARDQAPS
jgi:hypothetical protein